MKFWVSFVDRSQGRVRYSPFPFYLKFGLTWMSTKQAVHAELFGVLPVAQNVQPCLHLAGFERGSRRDEKSMWMGGGLDKAFYLSRRSPFIR